MAIWSIPAAKMKSKFAFRVPLSPAAVALVRSVMALFDCAAIQHEAEAYVARHDAIGGAPDRTVKGAPRLPLDLQGTGAATGYADHLSEAALAHQNQNGVRLA